MILSDAQKLLMRELLANNGANIKFSDFAEYLNETDLNEQRYELARDILDLEGYGFLRIKEGTFSTGGREHPVYKNRVVSIWYDKMHLTLDGQKFTESMI